MSRFSLGGWGGEEMSQRRRVDAVFADGVELTHIYDFGTESVTQVKASASVRPHRSARGL